MLAFYVTAVLAAFAVIIVGRASQKRALVPIPIRRKPTYAELRGKYWN